MAFRFLHRKNRNAAKRFGSSSAQGCGGQERMMGFGEEGEKGPFLVYYYLSLQLLPLARMGLQLVGAKGEEQLLDKLKSYATVTGV